MVDYVKLAQEAMEKPEYYARWIDDEMFITYGYSGIAKHRDSNNYDKAHFDGTVNWLSEREDIDEDDWNVDGSKHWAVGWVDHLVVRILDKEIPHDEITEEDINPLFIELVDIALDYRDCCEPFDEQLYYQYEEDDTIESIKWEIPNFLDVDPVEVYSALHEQDFYGESDGHGEWYSKEDIITAAFFGGLVTESSHWEEIFEYFEDDPDNEVMVAFRDWTYALDRQEFEKTQGVLL